MPHTHDSYLQTAANLSAGVVATAATHKATKEKQLAAHYMEMLI